MRRRRETAAWHASDAEGGFCVKKFRKPIGPRGEKTRAVFAENECARARTVVNRAGNGILHKLRPIKNAFDI